MTMQEKLHKCLGILLLTAIMFSLVYSLNENAVQADESNGQISVVTKHPSMPLKVSTSSKSKLDVDNISSLHADNSEVTYEAVTAKALSKSHLKYVIPGGESIGVELNTLGLLVVGHHVVHVDTKKVSPGEKSAIRVGDIILSINDKKVKQVGDVKPIVQAAGEANELLHAKIKRGNKTIETDITPLFDDNSNSYQIGLYIRDGATGIGTISFYDAATNNYGALGHVISDADTQKPIEISNGKIVNSSVSGILKGEKGDPGEKQASFSMKDPQLGSITKNSPFGVFGKIDMTRLLHDSEKKPLPIGFAEEIKKGPAQILTVIEDDKVEAFNVEIISSSPENEPTTKGIVLKITDERLLDATGGIIQGMSGSPIIQDGKLIGAVTHVFVNDPTSGYGVHIEWMLDEAGINIYAENE